MIKYKCPKCGASCRTSHCNDCDKDIPMSCRYDDSEDVQSNSNIVSTPQRIGYKCPLCGTTCRTLYCYDCDRDIPMSTSNNATWHESHSLSNKTTEYYDISIGKYISINSRHKRFRIQNDSHLYSFSDLVNYELCENNSVIQKGGIGRAIIGGAFFGEVGAIVGAQTRKSKNVVDSLYIRITLKSSGMKKITFISSPTDRNGWIYKSIRNTCDEVISELELISAENQNVAAQKAIEQEAAPPPSVQQTTTVEQSPTLIADELLKLKQLLDMGVLTEEEFNQQKQKLLNT